MLPNLAKPCTTIVLALFAGVTARAADVTVTPAAGSGFVVKDAAGANERLRVQESGAITLPGVPGATAQSTGLCMSGAGLLGPCSSGSGGGSGPAYTAATGLSLTGTTFSVAPTYQLPQGCAANQVAQWSGSAWACASMSTGAGGMTLPAGTVNQTLRYDSTNTLVANPLLQAFSDGGLLAVGSDNDTGSIPTTGPGVRLMWYSAKAAFRAGYVDGTQWDDANIGVHSTAMDLDTTASGNESTAMGSQTTASGTDSTAMGLSTTASGNYSTAMGNGTFAGCDITTNCDPSATAQTAMGYHTQAVGDALTAMGRETHANGQFSTAIGFQTYADGIHSIAMGSNSTATGDFSIAMGDHVQAKGRNSFIFGDGSSTPNLNVAYDDQSFIIYAAGGIGLNGATTVTGQVNVNGSETISNTLTVNGYNSINLGSFATYYNSFFGDPDSTECGSGSDCGPEGVVAFYATYGDVVATAFDALSDARIKDIAGLSDPARDLATLNAIEITDYTMKDKIVHGNKPFKKVIAQQVEKVYPQLISRHTDFIPDVYKVANRIEQVEGGYKLGFDTPHGLAKTAKKLRLLPEGKTTFEQVDVVSVPSEREVVVKASGWTAERVFVYGEEVDDLRTVDYEGLTTLNVSATQELSKLLDVQQTRQSDFVAQLANKDRQIAELQDRLAAQDAKLAALQTQGGEIAALKAAVVALQRRQPEALLTTASVQP